MNKTEMDAFVKLASKAQNEGKGIPHTVVLYAWLSVVTTFVACLTYHYHAEFFTLFIGKILP